MTPAHLSPFKYSHISTRLSLRWLPEEPFENTDTLVLMVGEWYVDLRVDKQSGRLDWAIAGQCFLKATNPRTWAPGHLFNSGMTQLTASAGRIVFTHDIDSNNNFNVSDPCPFIPLPNGDDLETGTMSRPDVPGTPLTDYEEVWRYLPPASDGQASGPLVAWVLESDDGDELVGQRRVIKTFLGRIGDRYLALQQDQMHTTGTDWRVKISGGEVSARSEVWCGGHWEHKYALGVNQDLLPSISKDFDGLDQASWEKVGQRVRVGGRRYIVRAFEKAETQKSSKL